MHGLEKEVHLTLDPDGQVEIEVHNVQGPACKALSQPYESLFATVEEKTKPEYLEAPNVQRARQAL